MILCAAGDIHGALDRMYEDVLAFEATLGVRFEWVLYVFGAVLVISGLRMLRGHGPDVDPDRGPVLRLFRKLMPV